MNPQIDPSLQIAALLIRMLTVLLCLLGFPLMFLHLAAMPDHSPTSPRFLERSFASIQKSRGLAPAKIVTQIIVRDGAGKLLGTITTIERLNWQGTKPVWAVVSREKTGTPGFMFTLELGFEANPSAAVDEYGNWHAMGSDSIAGENVLLWQGTENGDPESTATLHIGALSGLPRRIDYRYPVNSLGVKSVNCSVHYGDGPNGSQVPTKAMIDQVGRFLLIKRRFTVTKTFHGWSQQPGDTHSPQSAGE